MRTPSRTPAGATILPLSHYQIQEAPSESVHPSLVTHLQPFVFHKQETVHCEKYPRAQGKQ